MVNEPWTVDVVVSPSRAATADAARDLVVAKYEKQPLIINDNSMHLAPSQDFSTVLGEDFYWHVLVQLEPDA